MRDLRMRDVKALESFCEDQTDLYKRMIAYLRSSDEATVNQFYVSLTWKEQRLFNKSISKMLRSEANEN